MILRHGAGAGGLRPRPGVEPAVGSQRQGRRALLPQPVADGAACALRGPGGRRGPGHGRVRRRGWRTNRDRPPHRGLLQQTSAARACRCCTTSARRSRGRPPTATPPCAGCSEIEAEDREAAPTWAASSSAATFRRPYRRLVPRRLHHHQLPVAGIPAAAAGRNPAQGRRRPGTRPGRRDGRRRQSGSWKSSWR